MKMTTREKARLFVLEGNYKGALKISKKWDNNDDLVRGYECMIYPEFYQSIGYDTSECIEKAKAILHERLNI